MDIRVNGFGDEENRHMEKTGLLLIDVQNDYFPGGRMELDGIERAAVKARELLDFFRAHRQPVVFVRHVSMNRGASFFLPQTAGAEIHASVKPLDGEAVVVKHHPNSFRETDLRDRLRREGITHLVLAGMMTHMCVDGTVRAAHDLEFSCWTAEDACATRNVSYGGHEVAARDVHAAFLAALHGTYGWVMSAEQIIKKLGRPHRS
jgi:nicotinamidase-related amidase